MTEAEGRLSKPPLEALSGGVHRRHHSDGGAPTGAGQRGPCRLLGWRSDCPLQTGDGTFLFALFALA